MSNWPEPKGLTYMLTRVNHNGGTTTALDIIKI
jgi:hypothetical protein